NGDKPAAETHVRQALVLNKEFEADVEVYPKALRDLVGNVREGGRVTVTFRVTGLPSNGFWVIEPRWPASAQGTIAPNVTGQAVAGRHWILGRAPGFRDVLRVVTKLEDAEIPFGLPLSLPEPETSSAWIAAADTAV